MQVKNISSRPHWVGDVLVAPGETATISDEYENSINTKELTAIPEINVAKVPKKSKPVAMPTPVETPEVGIPTAPSESAE